MKTDLFQSCGHCWVFQICWHIEHGTFTASSFRIWNSSTGIPSPPPALFLVMFSKAHLTSHSRMYWSENPRDLKNYSKSSLSVLHKWNNKAWMKAHLFSTWFTLVRPNADISFKVLVLTDNVPSTFKSYSLRHVFNKTIAVIYYNSSGESLESKLKTFWKLFNIF